MSEQKNVELVKPGKRGVTNKQMIPVLKQTIDNNDIDKIKALADNFAEVFESSTKYIGKNRQQFLERLG